MRKRARITITLDQKLLEKVDQLKLKHKVDSRSQMIEKLLSRSLKPEVNTAVILAGGSDQKGKMLLKKIADRYLFGIMMQHLKEFGIEKIVVLTTPEIKPLLKERFGNGQEFDLELVYVGESKPLGTAGALKNADYLIGGKPFLVVHGDVLTDLNLHDFFEFHLREGVEVTIGVKPRMGEKKYGQVFLQGNKIIRFLKTSTNEGISIINTGLYVINPSILKRIPPNQTVFLETDIFPKLASEGKLGAFIFQGAWFDISDRESLMEAMIKWR